MDCLEPLHTGRSVGKIGVGKRRCPLYRDRLAWIIRFRWNESWLVQMPQVREPLSFDSLLAQSMDTKVSSLPITFEGTQGFDIIPVRP